MCEIQVTIGGLLPPSWHGGSSAHILVLPNQPKPVSQPDCSIQNSCMHDRSERFLLPGRSHQVAACMPCCLALPCTPAIQVVRSVQLSQIRRSVKSIDPADKMSSKYLIVSNKPSSISIRGLQSKKFLAFVMSGLRCLGSSSGRGL